MIAQSVSIGGELKIQSIHVAHGDRTTLEDLLQKAGITNGAEMVLSLQKKPDAAPSRVEVEFNPCTHLACMGTILFEAKLKRAEMHEVLIAAAEDPVAFRQMLEVAPIVVPIVEMGGYLIIELNDVGEITLFTTDRADHIRSPFYIAGVCFQ